MRSHTVQLLGQITFRQEMLKHFRAGLHASQKGQQNTGPLLASVLAQLLLLGGVLHFEALRCIVSVHHLLDVALGERDLVITEYAIDENRRQSAAQHIGAEDFDAVQRPLMLVGNVHLG